MTKLERLLKELSKKEQDQTKVIDEIKAKVQIEANKLFDKDKELKQALIELENSNDYNIGEYGELESWIRFNSNFPNELNEYFENYLSENFGYIRMDFKNDALISFHGDDFISIQDDARHNQDNGIWQGQKMIIKEDEYRDENPENEHYERGEINIAKRNELIEQHMEKTGYFPGVFRVDYHGNVFSVNTKKKEG